MFGHDNNRLAQVNLEDDAFADWYRKTAGEKKPSNERSDELSDEDRNMQLVASLLISAVFVASHF